MWCGGWRSEGKERMAISKNNETLEREPSTMQSTRVAGPHKAVCYLSSWEKKTKKHTSKKKRYYITIARTI